MKKMLVHACARAVRTEQNAKLMEKRGWPYVAGLVQFEESHVVVMPLVDTATGIMQATEVLCPGWPAVPV